jgi:hypothetical protein
LTRRAERKDLSPPSDRVLSAVAYLSAGGSRRKPVPDENEHEISHISAIRWERLAARRGAAPHTKDEIGNPDAPWPRVRSTGAGEMRKTHRAPSREVKGRPWVAFWATGTQCFNSPEERRRREGIAVAGCCTLTAVLVDTKTPHLNGSCDRSILLPPLALCSVHPRN